MTERVIKTPDVSKLTAHYVNRWVALSEDYKEVLASGETLAEVLRRTAGEKRKVVFRVLPNLGYAPHSTIHS
jgi:hypothetical protein